MSMLAGLGMALVGTSKQPAVAGMDECPLEGECTVKKPNFLFVLDYSTAMNTAFEADTTRWEMAVSAVQQLMVIDSGFINDYSHVALMRFGHDPDPDGDGTLIPGDASGLVDGQQLDVHWYDPDSEDKGYFECNGQAVIDALDSTPAPLNGNPNGIGTWTKGALERAQQLILQSHLDHPDDVPSMNNRYYGVFLLTHGDWTNPDGVGQSPEHDPTQTAAELLAGTGLPENAPVQTSVVFYGDEGGPGEASAKEIALAGGSQDIIPGAEFDSFAMAVINIVNTIKDELIVLDCTTWRPHIMVILDASSSMLNSGGGAMAAPKGESGWDQARLALAGDQSMFDVEANVGTDLLVEDLVQLGLLVFGDNTPAPGEQKVLVNYGPCMKDNFRWALSPEISHPNCPAPDYTPLLEIDDYITPDCDDPYNGPPITWEFEAVVGGLPDPHSDPQGPGFDADTQTHMPRCDGAGPACAGSGTYIHLGLELAAANQAQFHAEQEPMGNVDGATPYRNILLTHGRYDGYSTDAQVQAALEAMYQNGITTYVIGLGDGADTPQAVMNLQNMAHWGSGGNQDYIPAENQQQIEQALAGIVDSNSFEPCCQYSDCSSVFEPTTGEPDLDPGYCANDADCPENHVCEVPGLDMFGECVFDGCLDDDDCKPGEVCNLETNKCQLYCTDDSHCEDNQVCNKQTGACELGVCPGDFECQQGEVCKDGVCVQSCPDVPCGDGASCIDGVCVPESTTTGGTETSTGEATGETESSAGPTSGTGSESASTTGETTGEGCSCAAGENSWGSCALIALGFAGLARHRRYSGPLGG